MQEKVEKKALDLPELIRNAGEERYGSTHATGAAHPTSKEALCTLERTTVAESVHLMALGVAEVNRCPVSYTHLTLPTKRIV